MRGMCACVGLMFRVGAVCLSTRLVSLTRSPLTQLPELIKSIAARTESTENLKQVCAELGEVFAKAG